MSENPLYYSGSQTSKPSNLKPALSAALASLEVKLDEELARYRRTRAAHRTPIQKSLGSLIAAKPQAQSAITVANIRNQRNQKSLTGEEAVAYIRKQQVNNPLGNLETPPPPPRAPKISSEVDENQGTNSEPKQIPFINEQIIPPYTETTKPRNRTTVAQNQSSIVKTDINQNTQADNLPDSKNDATKEPDDYLESSEALLRSLAEEEKQQPSSKKPTNNSDSLLSPLSIGSMLLLLLLSITFGYIFFNLDNIPSFTLAGLFKDNPKNKDSENTDSARNINLETELTPIPKNPNLASDALPDIDSIDDIAGATPKPKPTTAAKPANVVTNSTPERTETRVEQMSPTVAANTPATPVSESKAALAPQNLDQIQPSKGGFYNVIVDNTGDTLSEVKKVIPDAYLSPEGKYVYLGAFISKE
ncbi:MAG: hypothetical protein ACFB2X_17980 [Rivularia sp. (in: cyanobacteria)]